MLLCMVLTLSPPKKKVCRVHQTWQPFYVVEYFFTCCHAAEAAYWACRMAQTFFAFMRKVMVNGALRLSLSLCSLASGCRIGTRKINSESMEEYTEAGLPKAGSLPKQGG
jgi:hypothetical protein